MSSGDRINLICTIFACFAVVCLPFVVYDFHRLPALFVVAMSFVAIFLILRSGKDVS